MNLITFLYFLLQSHRVSILRDQFQKRCVHFYACLCAFASDEKLSEEFSYYINLDSLGNSRDLLLDVFTSPQD